MTGHAYKITAVALQNRKLITISKKGGVWDARVTAGGKHYLDTGSYIATEARDGDSAPLLVGEAKVSRTTKQTPKRERPAGTAKVLSPTDRFISELMDKGEIKVVDKDVRRYEAYMRAALEYRKLPAGKRFATEGSRWSGSWVIRLEDAPAWMAPSTLEPIPVPHTLRNPHPVVEELRAGGGLFGIGKKVERRSLILIQALASQAQRRGFGCDLVRRIPGQYGRRQDFGHLIITVGTCSVTICLKQQNDRTTHIPSAPELAAAARYSYHHIPKYDYEPGTRLSLDLSGGVEQRRSTWKDGKVRRLEDSLAEILQEIDLRAHDAERRRQAELAAAAERQRRWEKAMTRAREQYIEDYKVSDLLGTVTQWEEVCRVRAFLDAARPVVTNLADPAMFTAGLTWIEWVENWIASTDPLNGSLGLPDVPDPEPDDLKPFLGGLSPYGPQAHCSHGWAVPRYCTPS
jgi:hypothetical protein